MNRIAQSSTLDDFKKQVIRGERLTLLFFMEVDL